MPPEPHPDPEATSRPVMGLLERALEFWLRQQCQAIGELRIRLEGSAAGLLRGRVEGVRLTAREVVYEHLEIAHVELVSAPLQVRMGALLRRRVLELEDPFQVRGQVAFSGEGLGRSLQADRWRSLGDALAADLLGRPPLAGLRLVEDHLLLLAPPDPPGAGERAVHLRPAPGRLEVVPLDGGPPLEIPIDPDIRIEHAGIGAGLLRLEGEARVQP
ncbi:MAG: DUF2993 domain-containing protein [Synechococcaceae cyanobacterium]|nr:DUF2993 domain-containing protein [Synechococcaceae cyanobacterium]